MRTEYVRRGVFALFGLAGVSIAIGALLPARAGSAIAPQPYSSPTVCTTAGICFEVDNNGHGIAVEGQALNKNGIGIRGLAPSTTLAGTGISGQAFGPSSIAVNGVAFSTDANHASQGVVGISANGAGVVGTTTFNSTLLITAASGVLGKDRSTAFGFDMGVEGTSTKGVGVAGISQNGNAVTGSSINSNGVVGQTSFFATSGQGQAGVLGQDLATPNPFGTPIINVGVEGSTSYGTGVYGISQNGVGIKAFSSTGAALLAQSNSGPALSAVGRVDMMPNANGGGLFITQGGVSVDGGNINAGRGANGLGGTIGGFNAFFSAESQVAISAYSQATPGPAAPPTLFLDNQIGGPIILATDGNTNVMSLDGTGHMILAGVLTENGSPQVAHRKPNGWGVATYSPQQTTQTIEDVGESQLEAGQSYVRLAPDFAALINKQSTYLVFLTPQGDCRGLYAAQKGQAGFYVRELGGGRSSIAFDYRIVARPVDSDGVRLPIVRPISSYHAPNTPLLSRNQKTKILRPTATKIRPGYVPSFNPAH